MDAVAVEVTEKDMVSKMNGTKWKIKGKHKCPVDYLKSVLND